MPLKTIASVLVTGVGGIVGQGIVKCLKMANRIESSSTHYKVIGADSSALAAGLYFCDSSVIVPNANDPGYVDSIIKVLNEYSVSALFVGTDQELDIIGDFGSKIEKETGTKVMTCSSQVIKISRDKWKTYEFLKRKKLSCVESCLPDKKSDFVERIGFPMVVKPREGYGSIFFSIVNNSQELENAVSKMQSGGWNPIIQEYIPGNDNEYTTGVLSDYRNNKIISSISIRKYLKCGQTYKGIINDFKGVRILSERVANSIDAKGPINIQTKLSGHDHKIFEINGRLSATCPMRAFAGINEPDLLYRNVVLSQKPHIISYKKLVALRYWNEVYVKYRDFQKVKTRRASPDHVGCEIFNV